MKLLIVLVAAEGLVCAGLYGAEGGDTLRSALQIEYERALELSSDEESVIPLLEVLESLQEEPLDLNLARVSELEQIPGLGPLVAFRIVSQRNIQPYQKVEDVANIEGVTPEILRALTPFVKVRRNSALGSHRVHVRTRAARSAIRQASQMQTEYPGSPDKLYTKIVARISELPGTEQGEATSPDQPNPSATLGLVTEKDPGESNYLDFISANLSASIPAVSLRFLLGDFVFEGGQGLVFWRSSGLSRGTEATSGIARDGVGFRPSYSTNQAGFFRGAAAAMDLKPATVSFFYSNKDLDASTDSNGTVTHFDTDGLHRTETEMKSQRVVKEQSYGARITSELLDGFQVGVSGITSRFDRMVSIPGISGFIGRNSSSFGLDMSLTRSSLSIFGEVAQDHKRSRAAVVGMVTNPCPGTNVALLARFYPRNIMTSHGSGFNAGGGTNTNESGFYCGLSLRPISWLDVNAYWDQFVFPWRTTRALLPSRGSEMLLRAEVKVSRRASVELHLRHKEKPTDLTTINPAGLTQTSDDSRSQQNYRATLTVGSPHTVVCRSRVEFADVRYVRRSGHETGLLVFQEVSYVPLPRCSVTARIIAFDTPSYDSRVYEYEDEVPGTCQTPALSGRGFRWYVNGYTELFERVKVSFKYSQTRKDGARSSAFSGEGALTATDDHLTIQIDVKL